MTVAGSKPGDHEYLIGALNPAFIDDRGVITNILDGAPISHIALITSKKGSVRGNHYHPAGQYIYIISGALQSLSCLPENHHRLEAFVAHAGDLLYCPPNVAHAYLFLEDTLFINADEGVRGPDTYNQDTTPYILLPQNKEVQSTP